MGMDNSDFVQNRYLGHIYHRANWVKPTHTWICTQQYVYKIYKETSNTKVLQLENVKKLFFRI